MRKQLALLFAGFIANMVSAWDNNCPVSGRRPAFSYGTNKVGIDLEVVYDLLCPDSAAGHQVLMQFLNMTWNVTNTKVSDQISVAFTFLPLPWHNEVFIPHQMIPYIWDNCQYGPNPCIFMDYMQFAFDNQEWIWNATDMSENQIIQKWTGQVAQKFNLNQTELISLYTFNYDRPRHDTFWRTILMYKYNTQHHFSSTPSGRVNAIMIENYPNTTDQWMDMLNTVYQSQYRPAKVAPSRTLY